MRGDDPDGDGEDELIKNAEQFLQYATDMAQSLTSIEAYGWRSLVTPMPSGVFQVLEESQTLKALGLTFSTFRYATSHCEYLQDPSESKSCLFVGRKC